MLEINRIIAYIQATMTVISKRVKQGKRELYGEDAQSLYLAGKELAEIQHLLPVALATLKRWHQEERWEEKRRQVPVSPRWLGEALKGILREKAGRLIIKGDLKAPELDELSKIVTLLDRLCSQGWDMRAAALASFALAMGWLSQEQYQVILGLLASLGLAALRSGVAKTLTDQIEAGGHDEVANFSEGAKPTARFRVGANG